MAKGMNLEMESIYSIKAWTLVELPVGVNLIGCKWIYKKIRGIDRKVETYKARLVAKVYTQNKGIDYEETFSPATMLKSMRILFFTASTLDYTI